MFVDEELVAVVLLELDELEELESESLSAKAAIGKQKITKKVSKKENIFRLVT
ncbi:hypothetical protein SY212_13010 [Ligilactobacillus agilis]|uniref:Uncharacterized protein n=1 Tax=Ligilactobacillus agilis TaxID=1601 RepID=A0A6F9YM35_9LACO|nr:hypothetical protein SY212_13010 [Ligilactobacillus agilis]GET18320.1 hypothetical protein PTL465_06380 [Ligilactobacillus agilis]